MARGSFFFAAVASALMPNHRPGPFRSLLKTKMMDRPDVFVDARDVTDLQKLKETLESQHLDKIDRRWGEYNIDVPAEHLRALGLFLEDEHYSLMCEGRILESGAGRLTWRARQGGIMSVIRRKMANSFEEVLPGGCVGTENITPLPVGDGFLAPDVSGFVRRLNEAQGLLPLAAGAPWPQVWVELAFTDASKDYDYALEKIRNCVRDCQVAAPCAYVLVALQTDVSGLFETRMALDEIDLEAPSVRASPTNEPEDAPKVAVWLPGTEDPSWYVLRTNRHVDIPIPTTGDPPTTTWRFESSLVCQRFQQN